MTTLTFDIEGPPGRVPAAVLAAVLTESLSILEDLRRTLARGESVKWYVTALRMGSAVAELTADSATDASARVGHEYVGGLRVVESGEGLPPYFPDSALKKLIRISRPLGTKEAAWMTASVGENGHVEESRITGATRVHIEELRSPRSKALGSITGILDTISLRGSPPKFQVLDPVSRRPVTCQFAASRTDLVKKVLGQRVTVRGTVVRNSKGQPLRVEDPVFDVVPASPPLASLVGIDRDFTGGLPLDKYLEVVRAW